MAKSMFKWQWIILCAACFSAIPPARAGVAIDDGLARIREKNTIVLAYRKGQLPFSDLDENNKVSGYSIALCQKIADAVKRELKLPHLKVQYLAVDGDTRFSSILSGQADIECGSTTNNAERRNKVAFTIPHFFTTVRMLTRADSDIRNWIDLQSKKVGVTRGGSMVEMVRTRSSIRSLYITLVPAIYESISMAQLESGEVDACVNDTVLLHNMLATAKNPAEFIITGDPLSVEQYGLMLRKEDTALKKLADLELAHLADSGEIYRIYDHWFMQPIGPRHISLNMPMSYLLRDALRYPTTRTITE